MPKSKAEIMRALRARRKAQGLDEVRGIYTDPKHHKAIRNEAEKLIERLKAEDKRGEIK